VTPIGLTVNFCAFWSLDETGDQFEGEMLIVAHRGASGTAPENTLAAFQQALDIGVGALEMDVHLSRDGEVVVIHDATVDRTTNGTGNVSDLTLSQLKKLDAGSRFAPQFAGEGIPTLQEVLDLAQGKVIIEIELKTTTPWPTPLERKVAELVVRNGLEDKVIIQSFNPLALFYLRRINSDIARALLYHERLPLPLRQRWLVPLARPQVMHPSASMATEEHVRKMQRHGHPVVVWTVDDPAEMETMIERNVDGIMTNRPDVLKEVLKARS
jgi:glycerophosphoryl diester phosphodiesterase